MSLSNKKRSSERGQSMTEYILIIALIAIAAIAAVKLFGGKIFTGFEKAADKVEKSTK